MEINIDTSKHELLIVENGITESYIIDSEPVATSTLVLKGKEEILHEMNLDNVLINLERAGDLMFVAYNGVAGAKGGQIQAKMSGLQKTLADLCNDCVLAMQMYEKESIEVLGYLIKTYSWLLKGQEEIAIKQLIRCEGSAKKMADESEKLADRFDAIAKTTEEVLEATQTEQGAQNEKRQEMEKQLKDLEAETKRVKKLHEEIAAQAQEIQELYNEAKQREESESNKTLILGITSAITSAVGAGVAGYMAASNPIGSMISKAGTSTTGTSTPESAELQKLGQGLKDIEAKADKANKDAADAEKEAEEAKKKASKADEEAASAKKKSIEASEAAEKDPAKIEKADVAAKLAKDMADQAEKLKKEAEESKKTAETKRAAADGVNSAMKDLSDKLSKMQEASSKVAESVRSEKMQLLTQKLDLQKQNREALAAIAEYAERVKNTSVEKGIAESAVESLHLAIRALKQIVTSLLNASLFWRSMEQYCRSLSESKLKEQIDDVKDLDLQERQEFYFSKEFALTTVLYLARWKALQIICSDYLAAANKARNKVLTNINEAPTIEESHRLAPILAEQMLSQTTKDLKTLEVRTKAIEDEKNQLAAQA